MYVQALFFLTLLPKEILSKTSTSKVLGVGCFLPGYSDQDYFGYATALEMATDWINKNKILPENHTIELDCADTLVRRTLIRYLIFDICTFVDLR